MATYDDQWSPDRKALALREQGYAASHILEVTGCDARLLEEQPGEVADLDAGSEGGRERARALRQEGVGLQEIARRLGISPSTAYGWTRGAVEQRLTAARRRREDRILEAQRLRRQGASYKAIGRATGVSSATAHAWTRDTPLPDGAVGAAGRSPGELREAGRRRWAVQHQADDQERRQVRERAEAVVGEVTQRDLLLLGAVAYWCEGVKSKPWAPRREQVRFINSDPALIRLFLQFLSAAGVPPERVQYRLSIHESADVDRAQSYWAGVVGARPHAFLPATLKKHVPLTRRRNTGEHYRGCLVVQVLDGRRLYWSIDALVRSLDTVLQSPGRAEVEEVDAITAVLN